MLYQLLGLHNMVSVVSVSLQAIVIMETMFCGPKAGNIYEGCKYCMYVCTL